MQMLQVVVLGAIGQKINPNVGKRGAIARNTEPAPRGFFLASHGAIKSKRTGANKIFENRRKP